MRSLAIRATALSGALAVALAGCGGAERPDPPTPTSSDTRTVAFTAPANGADSVEVGAPAFPAESPLDVIELAALRPDAVVVYDASDAQGTSTVEIARRGPRARVRVDRDGTVTAVGVDVPSGKILYTCTGGECVDGDPDRAGSAVLGTLAGVLGSEALRSTFSALVALPSDEVGVGQDDQAGVEVSCTAGSADGSDLRLCVTREGAITELTDGPVRLVATDVAAATAADVERPEPDAAFGGHGGPLGGDAGATGEDAATDGGEATAEDDAPVDDGAGTG